MREASRERERREASSRWFGGRELCNWLCIGLCSAARPIWLWDWAWVCVLHPTPPAPRSFVTCGPVGVGCTPTRRRREGFRGNALRARSTCTDGVSGVLPGDAAG